jgi:type I restriction enzyme, S subunit
MGDKYSVYKLGDICNFQNGFAFQSTDYVEPNDNTYEVFRMGYISRGGGYKEDDKPVFVPKQYSRSLDKFVLNAGDITIAMTDMKNSMALLGHTAIVPVGNRFVLNQRVGRISVKRTDIADQRFIYYYSNEPQHIAYLRSRANSGVQVNLSTDSIKEAEILLPPLSEQRSIARILGSLDDKIELNRRMNTTLEEMARAIFKSWFVDFDPVHAKARGEQPIGIDANTAALFPDSFEESELGRIPVGWQVIPIGEHVTAIKGVSYKGEGLTSEGDGLPMHNLDSVLEFGGYKYEGIKWYSGDYQPRHIVHPGDLIVANTEQGFNLLLIGSPALVPAYYGEMGLYSHHIYKVESKAHSPLTRTFLYQLINSYRFRATIQGYTNGTTVNMLPADAFEMPLFVLPPDELITRFDSIIAPMHAKQEACYAESQTLTELRDTLLPKLITGELRITDTQPLI